MIKKNLLAFLICSTILIIGLLMALNSNSITTNSGSFFIEK
ncbi:MAG: hypothetical protein RSB67_01720 [Clostridia bacterium]